MSQNCSPNLVLSSPMLPLRNMQVWEQICSKCRLSWANVSIPVQTYVNIEEEVHFDLRWQRYLFVPPIFYYALSVVRHSRWVFLVPLSFSTLYLLILEGWICWSTWRRLASVFPRFFILASWWQGQSVRKISFRHIPRFRNERLPFEYAFYLGQRYPNAVWFVRDTAGTRVSFHPLFLLKAGATESLYRANDLNDTITFAESFSQLFLNFAMALHPTSKWDPLNPAPTWELWNGATEMHFDMATDDIGLVTTSSALLKRCE